MGATGSKKQRENTKTSTIKVEDLGMPETKSAYVSTRTTTTSRSVTTPSNGTTTTTKTTRTVTTPTNGTTTVKTTTTSKQPIKGNANITRPTKNSPKPKPKHRSTLDDDDDYARRNAADQANLANIFLLGALATTIDNQTCDTNGHHPHPTHHPTADCNSSASNTYDSASAVQQSTSSTYDHPTTNYTPSYDHGSTYSAPSYDHSSSYHSSTYSAPSYDHGSSHHTSSYDHGSSYSCGGYDSGGGGGGGCDSGGGGGGGGCD